MWKKLHHPNLVPMLGLISSPVDYTGVIVPWYDKGTAPEYLKTTQGDNILPMVRFSSLERNFFRLTVLF